MKRAISINLSGFIFNIDEDAYIKLKEYLDLIERHFADERGGPEILSDIEGRIAELLHERNKGTSQVVTVQDVDEIIRILGRPEEIGSIDDTEESSGHVGSQRSRYRRIYRDPDSRILGGVCGGMGAYFHIDSLVFRILFLILFFGFGSGLLLYLILWIVIPEAKTRAQKLEMRGEPVNISNLGKKVKEEFNQVRNNIKL